MQIQQVLKVYFIFYLISLFILVWYKLLNITFENSMFQAWQVRMCLKKYDMWAVISLKYINIFS